MKHQLTMDETPRYTLSWIPPAAGYSGFGWALRPGASGLPACTACAMTGDGGSGEARGSGVGEETEVAGAGAAALLCLPPDGLFTADLKPCSQLAEILCHSLKGVNGCSIE